MRQRINNSNNDSLLEKTLKTCKRAFGYLFFFGFIISILTISTSVYALQVFDRVLSSGSIDTLIALTFVMFGFLVALGLLQIIRAFILMGVSDFLNQKLSDTLLHVSISNSAVFNNMQGGQNLRDLGAIKGFLTGSGVNSLIDAPWCILYIIAIFFIHPTLCIMVILSAILLLILAYYNEKTTKPILDKASEINIKGAGELELSTRNAEVIEAMGMRLNIVKNWNEINKQVNELQTQASKKSSVVTNITKTLRMFIYVLSTAVGAYLVLGNKMSPGGIIAASILSGKALAPFDAAMGIWKQVINTRKSYNRLNSVMKNTLVRQEAMKLPEPKGNLSIEKIAYISPKTKQTIIKGINIQIKAGEIIGIIGPSGAGKTTFAKIISGIWKCTTGIVRLDGADIYTWNRDDITNHLGYLPQDIELFNGTVKDNIARMDKEADPNKVVEAAQDAFVHDLILHLQKGYETDIGIGGSELSAGQRQRIALARAFYNNPKLIILDEPNSNLDQNGDIALAKAIINAKKKSSTIIVISHRPSILKIVDKLLVIHEGEAKIFGNRDEVLSKLQKNQKQIGGNNNG